MSAAPVREFEARDTARARRSHAGRPTARVRPNAERRRRQRHFARRRRDLLEDVGLALLLTVILISLTTGLGVIALLEIPIAGILVGSVVAPRLIRRRQRLERERRLPRRG